jgi:hypothetical protein
MFRRVGLTTTVSIAALGLALSVPAAAAATQAAPAGPAVLKNAATGFCLDSNTSKQVYTLDCNGGTFQRWTGI